MGDEDEIQSDAPVDSPPVQSEPAEVTETETETTEVTTETTPETEPDPG